MLQQGTRPHCKQASSLFTWPNYPNSMGVLLLEMARSRGSSVKTQVSLHWEQHQLQGQWRNNGKKKQHGAKSSEVRISFAQDSWCKLCTIAKSPKRYLTPWYKPLKGTRNLWRLLLFKSYTSVKDKPTQTLTKICITPYIGRLDASFTSKSSESFANKARTTD